jgi:hypothetical protein
VRWWRWWRGRSFVLFWREVTTVGWWWRWSFSWGRGRIVRRLMMRATFLGRRWVTTNWERFVMRLLPVGWSGMVPMLRWSASVVPRLAMLGLLRPIRFFERWLWKMPELFFVNFVMTVFTMVTVVTMDLVEGVVCSFSSLVNNCLGKTLQTVAVLHVLLEVCLSVFRNGLLLDPDKILELLELCSHPVQFVHFLLDAELWELTILIAHRLKAPWIGICDDLIG